MAQPLMRCFDSYHIHAPLRHGLRLIILYLGHVFKAQPVRYIPHAAQPSQNMSLDLLNEI